MRELNEGLVTALRTHLPTNATTLQTFSGAFAVFAQLPVPDAVATKAPASAADPLMYLTVGPTVSDENPLDKGANQREVLTQVTVWAMKEYHSASSVDLKAQEIITELHRQPARVTVTGWSLQLIEVQGVVDNDVDYWFGRVVGVRALLDKN